MFDDIEKHTRIFLCIQRRPTRNALAGKGTGKYARNDTKTRMFAEDAAKYIGRTYHFHDQDRRVDTQEIVEAIFGALRVLPDNTLKRYAAKISVISEPAVDEIAAQVIQALAVRWAISYHPSNRPLPPTTYSPPETKEVAIEDDRL